MALPDADRAVVAVAKVTDYLLSPEHPVGRTKAVFFRGLGYRREDPEVLREHLLELARTGSLSLGQDSPYGTKFEVRGTIIGPAGGTARIVTVWIVTHSGDAPRFVTAYPEGR